MIAVLGHLDVVPAGDGWSEAEPFSGEVKNGRIYGRGAMDDKGPVVAAIYALAALKDAGFAPARRIRIPVSYTHLKTVRWTVLQPVRPGRLPATAARLLFYHYAVVFSVICVPH